MSREAMKLALEALESGKNHGVAIDVLRRALAEPQEKYIYGTPLLDAMTGKANEALDKKAENAREIGLDYEPAQQEPVAWVYPEGLEALKNGKPWTAYGTKQEANNTALYLHPTPEREPYAWVTFTPYGDEDDVWYENPEGKLLEGWTYKPLYDATPLQSTWVDLTEAEIDEICLGDEAKVRTALQLLKEKNT